MCLCSRFIMACKYHHLSSWGQTEGKKKQAVSIMGAWSMCQGIWMEICPESSESSFGARSSPVSEPPFPGRRFLRQIQTGLSHPPSNWTITSKWGGSPQISNYAHSTGKNNTMWLSLGADPGVSAQKQHFFIVYWFCPVIVHAWQVASNCEASVFLMICRFFSQGII